MNHPPKCSQHWTPDERLALVKWISGIFLDRVNRDNPAMPVVAKAPTYEVFRTIALVCDADAAFLEANREALEKPYDKTKDRCDWWIAGDPTAVLQACR